jgi:hypothetical protein
MHRFTRHTHQLLIGILLFGFSIALQAQENLLANPGFATNLSGWDQYFGRIGEWSAEDADTSSSSGSALLGNEGTSDGIVPLVLHQCIPVQAGEQYLFGGEVLVPGGQPSGTAGWIFAYPFLNANCSGDLGGFENTGSANGSWTSIGSSITVGAGVQSVLFTIGVFKPAGETDDGEAYFDNLYFYNPEGEGFLVNPSMAASWFDPAQAGHGIMIHLINPNLAWMCWFTFDDMGNPAWICALGDIDGDTITFGTAFTVDGGVFPPDFDPDAIVETPWGSITVVFSDCDSGFMTWTTNAPGYQSGSMPLVRLTDTWGKTCN